MIEAGTLTSVKIILFLSAFTNFGSLPSALKLSKPTHSIPQNPLDIPNLQYQIETE